MILNFVWKNKCSRTARKRIKKLETNAQKQSEKERKSQEKKKTVMEELL